jgi:hypothetical protein
MKFSWDECKNQTNQQKHGISFAQACYAFTDPYQLNIRDNDLDYGEERWVLLGKAEHHGLLVVVHIELHDNEIRIISARTATKHEQKVYEQRRLA